MSEQSLQLLHTSNTKVFLDVTAVIESELSGDNEKNRANFVNSFISLIQSDDSRTVETAFFLINNYFDLLSNHISIPFLKTIMETLSESPINLSFNPYLYQLFIRKGFEEKTSSFVSDNPFCMLFEMKGTDLAIVHDQMKLAVSSSSNPHFLEDFLLYSIRYDCGKLILHTLLPFYFSHFSPSFQFVKRLLEGEVVLSTRPNLIAPILSSCLQAETPDLVNCLLYSVLLTIQSQGDVYSTCCFINHTLTTTPYTVNTHSVLLCCSFFTEGKLTPIQVRSCSSLLSRIVLRWIEQKQDVTKEILITALLFAAIGNQQQFMHQIMQVLIRTEVVGVPQDSFCIEEALLLCYCKSSEYQLFQNHFMTFSLLFSSKKNEVDFCLETLSSIHDPYSSHFTLFLLALQYHTLMKNLYQLRCLYYHLADFVDSPVLTHTVLSLVYPLITTKETTCMGLQILTDCYVKDTPSFSKGYWVGIHRCLLSYPSDIEVHITLLNQLCRVIESGQVDKDEVVAIAAHMTRLYLSSSSNTWLLQALLQLLILLLERMIISPASLIELIQQQIETPELTSLCFEFFIECSSIRRYRRRILDILWTETSNKAIFIQEEAWSALASLPSSLLLDVLPQVVGVEGDALLALLMDRLKASLDYPTLVRSISRICCVVDGLFDNRKKGNSSPMMRSPIEEEFVSITSYWNDIHSIFNEFSRVQDLLFPLASYIPTATTRDEAIQLMNQCLHAIVEYPSFLLVPSLLQNSLLLYTQFVDKAIHEFTSHYSSTIHAKDLSGVLQSLASNRSPNAFLLYLHLMNHSASFIHDFQQLLHSISSYPVPLQHTFLLILPSIPLPSSLLPDVIAYYSQQLKFHPNDSWTVYILVGAARLSRLSIPENLWPSLQPLLQAILAPFMHLLQQSLQIKQSSRRRINESPLVMDALLEFAGVTQEISQEQTMTILSAGFSLLHWFHITGNTTLFTELLNATFEFCKAKYPIEFKISCLLAFTDIINGTIPVNDTIMKRLEVLILNGSNYASRLNTCKECTLLCNLLLHSFLCSHPSATELLQNHKEENKWIVLDINADTVHLFNEYERVLHWSFADILHLQYLLLLKEASPCNQSSSQQIQHSCYPFVAAQSTPSLQHNPILTLAPTTYTRQLWSLLYHTESSHPSMGTLVHCLLDALTSTYCPSGELTDVVAVILSLSVNDPTLLSRALAFLQSHVEEPQPLFSEFIRWYQEQHPRLSTAFMMGVLQQPALLTANSALFTELLLHCKEALLHIPAEESDSILNALGRCLQTCSLEVRESTIQTVNALLLSAKTAPPAIFKTLPRTYYLSMLKNFTTFKRLDCVSQMFHQLHHVQGLTLKDLLDIGLFAAEQDLWERFVEGLYYKPIIFQHPVQTLEQIIEKVEDVWGNDQAVRCCVLLLGLLPLRKTSDHEFDKTKWIQSFIAINKGCSTLLKDVLGFAIDSAGSKQLDMRHLQDTLKDILKYMNRTATKELKSVVQYCSILVEKYSNPDIQDFDSLFYNFVGRL